MVKQEPEGVPFSHEELQVRGWFQVAREMGTGIDRNEPQGFKEYLNPNGRALERLEKTMFRCATTGASGAA